MTLPFVCIVILNYNGAELTINCVDSVLKIDYPNFRVIVVDNASADDSVARFKAELTDPRVELLLNSRNEGYAGGNNRGIEKALSTGAEYVLVLNNDTLVDPGFLTPLVDAMEKDPKIGICGGPIYSPVEGSAPSCGHSLNLCSGESGDAAKIAPEQVIDADWLNGAALLIRSETLLKAGGFDEDFFLIYEEIDLCFRVRRLGFRTCFVPSPGLVHIGHTTLGEYRGKWLYFHVRNRAWFTRRHGDLEQRLLFTLWGLCYLYPRVLAGRIARRETAYLEGILRGIWEGHTRPLLPIDQVGRLRIENTHSQPLATTSA